jgi:hypothetical protein
VRADLLVLGDYSDISQVAARIRNSRQQVLLGDSRVTVRNLSLVESRPALCIEEMNLNQQNPLHQSHEFIVTCLAAGGPHMTFRWYKDDFLVETRLADRYMKAVVKDIRQVALGLWQRASVLTITKARKFDSGVFRWVYCWVSR